MNISVAENGSNFHSVDSWSSVDTVWVVGASMNLILGLPTNGYILWLMLTRVDRTMASEFFTLNLAVSEILYTMINCFQLAEEFLKTNILIYIAVFGVGLFYTSRLLFQCCICVEFYLGVVYPVIYLRYKPLRYRVVCCSVVWLLVLGSCFFVTYGSHMFMFNYVYLVQFLVLLSVKVFCCISVLRALNRSGPGDGPRQNEANNDVKRKAFKTILIILVSMSLGYSAHIIARIFKNVLSLETYNLFSAVSILLNMITGFVQPLLFLHRAGKLACIKGI